MSYLTDVRDPLQSAPERIAAGAAELATVV